MVECLVCVFPRWSVSTVGEGLGRGRWEGVLGVILLLLLLAWRERGGGWSGREILLLLEVRVVSLPTSGWGGGHGQAGRGGSLSIIVVVKDVLLVG